MADKKFLDEDGVSQFAEETKKYVDKHANNADIHVTTADKANWNGKQDALTAEQLAAVNSGINATAKVNYDAHVANADIHVTADDKANWNGKQDALTSQQIDNINDVVNKANASDLTAHTNNSDIHVTATDKTMWNGKQDALSAQQLSNIADVVNKANASDLTAHTGNSDIHVTAADKPRWNAKQDALSAQQLSNIADVVNKANASDLTAHTNNSDIHVTTIDKSNWNGKQDALTSQQLANIADVVNKANDSDVVHKTGDETAAGVKTFSDGVVGNVTGNASSATKLQTARTINGTSFNGTANITTANWGTARNISITDGTNTSTAVSVNGSNAYSLNLPSTIKATFVGNITGNVTGNADTSTKATNNASGNALSNDIIKGLSVNGKVITYTKLDGSTGTITTQDTNTTYSNFVKSGSGAKAGLVPAPSTTAGTTKYLREDGTWQVPPDHTYTVNNATLTIQKNGTTVKTFTANASANVTANIVVPTKTSELTNDSGFLTTHNPVDNALSSTSTNAVQNKVITTSLEDKANDDDVVHKTGNEIVGGTKTFTSHVRIEKTAPDISLYISDCDVTETPTEDKSAELYFKDKNGQKLSYVAGQRRTSGVNRICVRAQRTDDINNYYSVNLDSDGDFYPEQNNAINLGNSTLKWKTINGITPGALSLPTVDYATLDTTNFVLDGSTNNRISMPYDGWLNIKMTSCENYIIRNTFNGITYRSDNVSGIVQLVVPAPEGTNMAIIAKCSSIELRAFKSMGNV